MGKAVEETESEHLLHKANDPKTAGDTRGDWSKLTVVGSGLLRGLAGVCVLRHSRPLKKEECFHVWV